MKICIHEIFKNKNMKNICENVFMAFSFVNIGLFSFQFK